MVLPSLATNIILYIKYLLRRIGGQNALHKYIKKEGREV